MKQHLDYLKKLKELGFNIFPVDKVKAFMKSYGHYSWYNYNGPLDIGYGIGMEMSGDLEAIDFDLKYDTTGTLFKDYCDKVKAANPDLLQKMVVQKTMSNGYHFIYKCKAEGRNEKVASRPSTEEEKQFTYEKTLLEELEKGATNEEAIAKAEKSKEKDKVRVLIETRGSGGYIAAYPTPGYELKRGSFFDLKEITDEERSLLFSIAESFNTYIPAVYTPKETSYVKTEGELSPFEDYNNRADTVQLLINNGWSFVYERGGKVFLKRPGKTDAKTSGNYDRDKKWFSVFSSSTEFEPEKAYQPYAVFAILECNGDFSEAAKRLYSMGYGDRKEKKKVENKQMKKVEKEEIKSMFKIIELDDIHDKLKDFHKEGAKPGVSLGFNSCNDFYTMKLGSVTDWIGFPQSGKTELLLEFLFITSVKYGWKHLLCVPDIGDCIEVMAILIHKHTGKTFDKKYKNYIDWSHAYKSSQWILEHFKILEPQNAKNRISPVDFWEYAVEYKNQYGLHTATIDSWKDMYHDYDAHGGSYAKYLSEVLPIRNMLAEQNELHFHTVIHPKNPRRDDKGKIRTPQPDDMEGGAQWNNSGKTIISVHRDGIETKVADISILKVKPRVIGKRGFFCLNFDPERSRYYEIEGGSEGGKNVYATDTDHGISEEINKSNQFPGLIIPEEVKEPKPLTPNQEFDLSTNPDIAPF